MPALLFLILSLPSGVSAQASISYNLPADVLGSGGGNASSPAYADSSTAGQSSPTGDSQSSGYINHAGFRPAAANLKSIGDVDDSGAVNITDALFIARYVISLFGPWDLYLTAADVNCDNSINIIDALLSARKAVNLPAPGWCGQ